VASFFGTQCILLAWLALLLAVHISKYLQNDT